MSLFRKSHGEKVRKSQETEKVRTPKKSGHPDTEKVRTPIKIVLRNRTETPTPHLIPYTTHHRFPY